MTWTGGPWVADTSAATVLLYASQWVAPRGSIA